MRRLGRIPPAEAEAEYYDHLDASQPDYCDMETMPTLRRPLSKLW